MAHLMPTFEDQASVYVLSNERWDPKASGELTLYHNYENPSKVLIKIEKTNGSKLCYGVIPKIGNKEPRAFVVLYVFSGIENGLE